MFCGAFRIALVRLVVRAGLPCSPSAGLPSGSSLETWKLSSSSLSLPPGGINYRAEGFTSEKYSMAESVPCVYQTRFLSVWGSRLDYTF